MTKRTGRPPGLATAGPEIRRLRVGLGLTAEEIGARIGFHAESVRRAERGGPIGDVFASRLAKALGVEVGDIATEEPRALAS
jgi:transcriptional regulator with XRE-family HTH domain